MRAESKILLGFLLLGITFSIGWHLWGPQGSTEDSGSVLLSNTIGEVPRGRVATKDLPDGQASDANNDKENVNPEYVANSEEEIDKFHNRAVYSTKANYSDPDNWVPNCPHLEFLRKHFCRTCTFQPGDDQLNNETALEFLNWNQENELDQQIEPTDGWGTVVFAGAHDGKYNWVFDYEREMQLCHHVEKFPVISCNFEDRLCYQERENEGTQSAVARVYHHQNGHLDSYVTLWTEDQAGNTREWTKELHMSQQGVVGPNPNCPHPEFLRKHFCKTCTFQPGNDEENNKTALHHFSDQYQEHDWDPTDGWGTVVFAGGQGENYNFHPDFDKYGNLQGCQHVELFPIISCNFKERLCYLERGEQAYAATHIAVGRVYQYPDGTLDEDVNLGRKDQAGTYTDELTRKLHTFSRPNLYQKREDNTCPHRLFMKKHFCRHCTFDATNNTTWEQSIRIGLTYSLSRPNWTVGRPNVVVFAGPDKSAEDVTSVGVNPNGWVRRMASGVPDECFHKNYPTFTCAISGTTTQQQIQNGGAQFKGACYFEGTCKTYHWPNKGGHLLGKANNKNWTTECPDRVAMAQRIPNAKTDFYYF